MKRLLPFLLVLPLLFTAGCDQVNEWINQPARQQEKLQRDNLKLKAQVDKLSQELAKAEAEATSSKILVSLYDLRHALEKFAQQNTGKYPYAQNINEMQTILKAYLPENFEIEAVYIEKARSQPDKGYIMIAHVKGREIVVSNLL